MEPVQDKEKSVKLQNRWTGPWRVIREADPNGVTYGCKLMGRHVTFRTVHKSRMKHYRARPPELELADIADQGHDFGSNIHQLLDRKCNEDGDWLYLYRPRGSEHE
jgi:hypothetical protein